MYLILAIIFFSTLISGIILIGWSIFNIATSRQIYKRTLVSYSLWLVLYFLFILLGTGPTGTRLYSNSVEVPYKLPWAAGVKRWVSQGNRSFTSHRENNQYAWDFWMPIGSEILAARTGVVIKIEQDFDGIGLNSNYITIEHDDETRSLYAHIKKNGAAVKIGDHVQQGQLIAYSGMVGQTINPHLHFAVMNKNESESLPIVFADVNDGVPLAGHSYISKNGHRSIP